VRRFVLNILAMGLALTGTASGGDQPGRSVAEAHREYRRKLAELAGELRDRNMPAAADRVSDWFPPASPDGLTVFVIDGQPGQPLQQEAPSSWQEEFYRLRRSRAEQLYHLALDCFARQKPSRGMLLLHEAVRENPGHAAARRMLGYSRYQGRWHTDFSRRMAQAGKVWHSRFGWIDAEDVPRFEQGLRPFGNRWIDVEADAQRHRSIFRGWKIETEHYEVTTNHSLQAGVELAARLERLYQVWRQVFAGFYADADQVRRAAEGRPLTVPGRSRHEVIYFRDRDEYNRFLRAKQPNIAISLGIYFDTERRSYFFAGEDQDPGTLYHEAIHQLLEESLPRRRRGGRVGRQNNFWIIEGVATYMESLTAAGGYYTLGSPGTGRLPAAGQRLLVDKFYVPLATLVPLGMQEIQRSGQIAKIYSQAAGLSTFLMHAGDGRYREPLMNYLRQVYEGRAGDQTLSQLTGRSYRELDHEYRVFMEQHGRAAVVPEQQ